MLKTKKTGWGNKQQKSYWERWVAMGTCRRVA